jgi:hypothetical protein
MLEFRFMAIEAYRLAKRNLDRAALILITLSLVAGAYQTRRPLEIDLGSASASAPFVDDFHDAEGSYRWSRARSCVTFPDVGGGGPGRVELELSAYRPRQSRLPIAVVEAETAQERVELDRGLHTIALPATPHGVWSSDLRACVRSETFQPSPSDRRQLGVRVHRARWVPAARGPVVPPLRQVLFSCLTVLVTCGLLSAVGLRARSAFAGGVVAALALAAAYVFVRSFAAVLALPATIAASGGYAAVRFFPRPTSLGLRFVSLSAGCWLRGLRISVGWPAAALALLGAVALTGAYLARPTVSIDMGSGREASRTRRFASLDSESGVRFRRALQGAELDLRDFGSGAWRIRVTGSLPQGSHGPLPLVRARGIEAAVRLGDEWTTAELEVEAPLGWDSGLLLEFPVNGSLVDRVEVVRGRSLPSLRVLFATLGAALAGSVLAGASGLDRRGSSIAFGLLLLLQVAAVYADPLLSIPFASVFLGICAMATLVAALLGGMLASMRSAGVHFEEGPLVATTVSLGFVVWLTALSAPLYAGLHFIYHSNIAEEIWKGNFLIYYLPHPNNILSREAQWGGLLVPYSCLYHLLAAPLAALPTFWFQQTHKILQAGLLASTALAGALGAWRLASGKSSLWTAILFVSLPSTFQLLGLAHFLTVFGTWASTLALVYIIFSWGRLQRAARWWGGVGLLTLAFLSYTASLLFTGFTLAVALPLLARVDRRQAKHLLTAALAATVASLLLYYGHWVLPFVRESLPILFASAGEDPIPVGTRLALIPRKLGYSFGSVVLPLTGLIGVGLVTLRSRVDGRFILPAWVSVLVVFSFADVYFNFILKHHYFSLVPVTMGNAALLDLGMRRGGWTRWASGALLVSAVALGSRAALSLAMGPIE